ncbi:WXG100-like domain-containing protein [Kineosporia babensis]
MSIDLPEPVTWLLGLAGVYWPDIDEDAVRELAGHVRQFGDDLLAGQDTATGTISSVGSAYTGGSYDTLAASWSNASSGHMSAMLTACEGCALGLESTAMMIELTKAAAVAHLTMLATTVAAAQAATVATFGLSQAASAAAIAAARMTTNWLTTQLVGYITGQLILTAVGPLEEKVEAAVSGLVYEQLAKAAVATSNGTMTMDPDQVTTHAQTIDTYSSEVVERGSAFVAKAQAVSFG